MNVVVYIYRINEKVLIKENFEKVILKPYKKRGLLKYNKYMYIYSTIDKICIMLYNLQNMHILYVLYLHE